MLCVNGFTILAFERLMFAIRVTFFTNLHGIQMNTCGIQVKMRSMILRHKKSRSLAN